MAVAVIGAGIAGLAAGQKLLDAGIPSAIFEAEDRWGGHTRSFEREGFVFDDGPHVSFTKDEAVRDLFSAGAGEIVEFGAAITNFFKGHWVTHPAQCHLHGLDPELVAACVVDFVESRKAEPQVVTYADWCVAMFGKTFAETFPYAYTRKYWTVEAREMGVDWIGNRMYPPKLEDVVRGAIQPKQSGEFHYLSKFRYPAQGGFQSFLRALVRPESLRVNKRVTRLDLAAKRLDFADGTSEHYEEVISTMPLPELIRTLDPGAVPAAIREAAEKLLCTSVVLVDVAVRRSKLSEHHWFYVYDEDVSFARAYFPHMLSPQNAPAGCGSIQVEIYHSRHKPLSASVDAFPGRVVTELVRLGVLESENEVLWARARDVRYANVVFDHERAKALAAIDAWLDEQGVLRAGRYGEWAYFWTDDSARSGWRAADRVIDRSKGKGPR